MKRGKKIIVNICLVLLLLIGMCYLGGFYISKTQCELECLEAQYRDEKEKVLELCIGEKIYSLYRGADDKTFAMVSTEKMGFLYRNAEFLGMAGKTFDEQVLDIEYFNDHTSRENEFIIMLYRTDSRLTKVEVELKNGEDIMVDEWKQDFATYYVETEDGLYPRCIFYCYDETGKLIDEIDHTN